MDSKRSALHKLDQATDGRKVITQARHVGDRLNEPSDRLHNSCRQLFHSHHRSSVAGTAAAEAAPRPAS